MATSAPFLNLMQIWRSGFKFNFLFHRVIWRPARLFLILLLNMAPVLTFLHIEDFIIVYL